MFFLFKQKTAYEMRISDWSSDVCSSDLQMRREGATVAKCTIERLMRAMGLAGVRRGKTCVTTVSNPKAPCPLDKVNREFRVSRPNALWVVDFTYVHSWAGFVQGNQIGRASCRARVCQYRVDLGGSRNIKKKK